MDRPIIWFSGVTWDNKTHTDCRIVEAIGDSHDVVFVDAPHPHQWAGWLRVEPPAVEQVLPRVLRLRIPAPPLFSKPFVRQVTSVVERWTLRRGLPAGTLPAAVVVANPVTRFPRPLGGRRILFVTDDHLAGVTMTGLSRRWVRRVMAANAREADAVAAVTPALLRQLRTLGAEGVTAELLPNGAPPPGPPPHASEPVACLVGLLNERLDLACLEAVVDAGVRLRVIGPRVERDKWFCRRLDSLLEHPSVDWTGRAVPPDQVSRVLAGARVGLTPYLTNEFNQASFPLKTFDYLAAGLPVVSTDIFASRWLETKHVRIAGRPEEFAQLVLECIARRPTNAEVLSRQQVAEANGWPHRAAKLLQLAGIRTI